MDWPITEKGISQRRACALVGMDRKSYRYRSSRPDDAAVRRRLRELAAERRRFGYRRLLIRQRLRLAGLMLTRMAPMRAVAICSRSHSRLSVDQTPMRAPLRS